METPRAHPQSAGLRQLADYLDRLTAATGLVPLFDNDPSAVTCFDLGDDDSKAFPLIAKHSVPFRREFSDTNVRLIKSFDGGVSIRFVAARAQVCERVVVGVTVIPEQVIPEQIIPAQEIEQVEWRCHSLLEESALVSAEAR